MATCPHPRWEKVASYFGMLKEDSHVYSFDLKALCNIIKDAGLSIVLRRKFMWAPLAALPYLGIPLSPHISKKVDDAVTVTRFLSFLHVNQMAAAIKR